MVGVAVATNFLEKITFDCHTSPFRYFTSHVWRTYLLKYLVEIHEILTELIFYKIDNDWIWPLLGPVIK